MLETRRSRALVPPWHVWVEVVAILVVVVVISGDENLKMVVDDKACQTDHMTQTREKKVWVPGPAVRVWVSRGYGYG